MGPTRRLQQHSSRLFAWLSRNKASGVADEPPRASLSTRVLLDTATSKQPIGRPYRHVKSCPSRGHDPVAPLEGRFRVLITSS